MTESKLLELLSRIESKTMKGEMKWEATAEQEQFQTILANVILRIDLERVDFEHVPTLTLVNKDGVVMESIQGAMLRDASSRAYNDEWLPARQLANIHKFARRQALGLDKAIDDLLSQL
jgi:hypothetical protein